MSTKLPPEQYLGTYGLETPFLCLNPVEVRAWLKISNPGRQLPIYLVPTGGDHEYMLTQQDA